MDDDSIPDPPYEEPYTNFKEMHDLETGYEIEEVNYVQGFQVDIRNEVHMFSRF